MNRWTLTALVETQVLGFMKYEDLKKFEPLEEVLTITRAIAEDDENVTLTATSYKAIVRDEFFVPVHRAFKGAILYLGARTNKDLPHLVLFFLGQGYFALLTPIKDEEVRS